jgi:hypothetical protein
MPLPQATVHRHRVHMSMLPVRYDKNRGAENA